MTHGLRSTYQHDACRCPLCRAANALYQARVRRSHASGRPPLGSYISAKEAWRTIAALKREHFTQHVIAQLLGQQSRCLQLQPDVITVRNALKIRRLARLKLTDPEPDAVDSVDSVDSP